MELMVDHAQLSRDDTILEIGAGIGNLTSLLAARARKVIAIERDSMLVKILRERLKHFPSVELLHADALSIEFPKFNKVVANLPYGISSDITFKLLEHEFELAVLMYQKEFSERLVAKPGSDRYGRLTVNVHYRANVELLEEVPPTAFVPRPKVVSSIVRLKPRKPPFEVSDEDMFFRVVRALFQHRRQRVRNALYRSFETVFPRMPLSKSARRAFIDGKLPKDIAQARVMELAPEEFGMVTNLLALTGT